ncbi:hypothetical protein BV898_05666 [Hypsibius exemplaris]|uniref:Uncharacterized protein n=1 Tax=Hypsibius exemplaris TaxID=2072580 RepID=A0A1W0WYV4_HYPEX|nr:hypothetical protein BV898_05666 [Hypsibius exemplaris]
MRRYRYLRIAISSGSPADFVFFPVASFPATTAHDRQLSLYNPLNSLPEHIFAWDKGQPNDVSRFSESLTASRSPSNPACHSPASLTRSSLSTLEPSTKRVKRDVLVSNGDNRNDSSSASEAGTSRESKTLLDNNDSLCFPRAYIRSDNLLSVPTAMTSKDDISFSRRADQDASPHPSEAETSRESNTCWTTMIALFPSR